STILSGAVVNQAGAGNSSTIDQGVIGGHQANVSQTGLRNTSTVEQGGLLNSAGEYFDETASGVIQAGEDGTSSIVQSGGFQAAYVEQLSGSAFARSTIDQGTNGGFFGLGAGAGQVAEVIQGGVDNGSDVTQRGLNQSAFVTQGGAGNESDVLQGGVVFGGFNTGSDNTATVTQNGTDGISLIDQNGSDSTATLTQSGLSNES